MELNIMDVCNLYSKKFNNDYFLENFYGITQKTTIEQYYIDKLNLLRNDFPTFWLSLDTLNKKKFMDVIKYYENDNEDTNSDIDNVIVNDTLSDDELSDDESLIKNNSVNKNRIYYNRHGEKFIKSERYYKDDNNNEYKTNYLQKIYIDDDI
jgi:hypothetical protein